MLRDDAKRPLWALREGPPLEGDKGGGIYKSCVPQTIVPPRGL